MLVHIYIVARGDPLNRGRFHTCNNDHKEKEERTSKQTCRNFSSVQKRMQKIIADYKKRVYVKDGT